MRPVGPASGCEGSLLRPKLGREPVQALRRLRRPAWAQPRPLGVGRQVEVMCDSVHVTAQRRRTTCAGFFLEVSWAHRVPLAPLPKDQREGCPDAQTALRRI